MIINYVSEQEFAFLRYLKKFRILKRVNSKQIKCIYKYHAVYVIFACSIKYWVSTILYNLVNQCIIIYFTCNNQQLPKLLSKVGIAITETTQQTMK